MGYRSQVVLAISKELIPFLLLATSKNKEAEELVFKYGNLERNYENDKSWLMVWDSIKWYEGYPEVDEVSQFIEAMSSDDLTEYGEPESSSIEWSEHFVFVRVGEECDYIRREGYGPWHIFPQTSIHIGKDT